MNKNEFLNIVGTMCNLYTGTRNMILNEGFNPSDYLGLTDAHNVLFDFIFTRLENDLWDTNGLMRTAWTRGWLTPLQGGNTPVAGVDNWMDLYDILVGTSDEDEEYNEELAEGWFDTLADLEDDCEKCHSYV